MYTITCSVIQMVRLLETLCPNPAGLGALTHMDDEYCWAGVEDPKIVVTTSHDPSSRLKQFSKVGEWSQQQCQLLTCVCAFKVQV